MAHVVAGDAGAGGELAVAGAVAELLGQGFPGGAHRQQQFLVVTADPQLPAAVAEVPFDLAADARLGVRGQAVPGPGARSC